MAEAKTTSLQLSFGPFDERFLEKSWHWLHDPEIKALTLSPDFTREDQLRWFNRLPSMKDYLIWGLICEGQPVGAVGLKHLTKTEGECWGYIGERSHWGSGFGRQMYEFIFDQARKLGLRELYLIVGSENARAIHLYEKFGFRRAREHQGILEMRSPIPDAAPDATKAFVVRRYSAACKGEWDAFVKAAKNATFLFQRDYMEYHSHRFADHSLMVYRGKELCAVLPANRATDGTLISHEGLTYGGLVVARSATLKDVVGCFHAALQHLHENGIARLRYKRLPRFYNTLPDDEVDYAMFLLDAKLYRRDCAVVVSQSDRLPFQERRRREIKKARAAGIEIREETDFRPFWQNVLAPRLESRYGVKPVHTVEEITLLASRFPDRIRQFSAYRGDEILAGTTIFETPTVAHAQYIATTAPGQKAGALDFLFAWLMDERYKDKRFFDPGICNEKEGRHLNRGLLEWKEGFGGRACSHDFYEINTAQFDRLEPVLNEPAADSR